MTWTPLSGGEYFSALARRLLMTRPTRDRSASTKTWESGALSEMLRVGCSSPNVRICSTTGAHRSVGAVTSAELDSILETSRRSVTSRSRRFACRSMIR